ncbi:MULTISPECIES: MFS transporter [unclassified Achromobacter]|uniref:MFS transporter n=1 Tax=unclassified Achromobacter TaxID=2626865 RepID=UPI000B517568|nr:MULTISPECIES: MFS transporter [unclassified Achromobacter]OWT74998.1 MFS transporter [Achromobacter sp. HZ28]OWT76607.1 MFS transporter [Achromobacter sp. HZ34]
MNTDQENGTVRRGAILAAVCLAGLALPLSFSGGAMATPALGRTLGGSAEAMSWVTNAFMLSFGSLLMLAGALADRLGRKRIFAWGVGGFSLCAVAISLAPSLLAIDLLRAIQGAAAAAALAGGTAALAQEFEGPAATRAFGMLGATFGLGLAFGPVLAGWLVGHLGWRAVFLTGAAAGIPALCFGVPRMRETRDPHVGRFDRLGALLFTGALTAFTFGLIEAPGLGWGHPRVIVLLVAAAVLALAFVRAEIRTGGGSDSGDHSHVHRPMLDLSLFRYPRFVGVQLLPVATCYGYIVLLVLLPLRFIGVDGYDEMQAGTLMLALSLPMLCVPFLAVRLTRRYDPGIICGAGLVVAAAGLWALRWALRDGAGLAAVMPMLAIGVGAGLPWGLMDGLSISVVPKERAGMATGIFSTMRVAGEGVALASVTAILAALLAARLHADVPGIDMAAVARAAVRLATGDLTQALPLLPGIAPASLRTLYGEAFGQLLAGLACITLACSVGVLAFLGRRPAAHIGAAAESAR